ncbi:MAG TPA: HD-GYP domain-containing protein, partial [Ktedonobacteraceae bacterium]|nr:HD-GYP domain-containing protein [Ktedonobacteraceae bacterium]
SLANALDARDPYTAGHSHRVSEMSQVVARSMALPPETVERVRVGALLHDIGKVGVPDAILRKSSALTGEEWIEMRKHPEIGRQILDRVGGAFSHISAIVAAHHERWDGKGYPNGLPGEDIPLEARIITVVDAFDAMTVRRVYREPMPVEAARAELLRCSGKQFDPKVVAAFLSVLDEEIMQALRTQETGVERSQGDRKGLLPTSTTAPALTMNAPGEPFP